MRRLQPVLLALALCAACGEVPMEPADRLQPAFITFGQPDAGRHPYVVAVGGEEGGASGLLLHRGAAVTDGRADGGALHRQLRRKPHKPHLGGAD